MNKRMIILIALAAALFSIPAGAEINETQCGGGGNGTYPPGWNGEPTPAEDASVCEEVTQVRIRGEVVEPVSMQTGDIVWNASNFAAFWYDPDDDLMTETLRIISGTLSEYDRTIEESRIEYVTETMESDFDYSGWGEYDAMSFMAETYFAGYATNTSDDITGETVSLVSKKMLSNVLVDESDKHCIPTGASLELHEGYELKLIQLDIDGDLAQIELLRNGRSVDTDIIGTTETYVYTRDLGTIDDVPLIAIHVDSIIEGTENDMIVIDGIFQISEDYISVEPGDNYGEMEIVSTSSDTIRMENYDDIDLSEGDTINLMGDIYLVVAYNETLRFAPVAEFSEPGTYEVRGAVQSLGGNQSSEIVWDASNAAFFWYGIDSDASTETLEIAPGTLSGLDRTIDEGALVYATHPIYREYGLYEGEELTVDGHEGYLTEGWVGWQCVAINGRADKLCRLLVEFEGDDKKTLSTGESWDIGGGFTLTARQINLEADKVWFSLQKCGKELDSEVVSTTGTDQDPVYTYTADIGGDDDVPVFSCYVDAIFRGTDSNIVQVTYVFLIDDSVLEIDTGDRFGCMEVVTVSSAGVILKNDDAIDLDSGTTEWIMDDLYFKTADDSVIRFYPFVERIIGDAAPTSCVTIDCAKCHTENPHTIHEGPLSTGVVTCEACHGDGFGDGIPKCTRCHCDPIHNFQETISDADGDGVPDLWDKEADTPAGYWVNSDGIGRMWGDMNGDGKLTSVDALMILQAAAGNLWLTPTENATLNPPKPIYLDNYAFAPENPTIRVGEALNWINIQESPMVDFVLVSDDGLWDDQVISYGKKFKYTFNTSGSYTYYCPGYGSAMRGTVAVLE